MNVGIGNRCVGAHRTGRNIDRTSNPGIRHNTAGANPVTGTERRLGGRRRSVDRATRNRYRLRVRRVLAENTGNVTVLPGYGTLIGAVRNRYVIVINVADDSGNVPAFSGNGTRVFTFVDRAAFGHSGDTARRFHSVRRKNGTGIRSVIDIHRAAGSANDASDVVITGTRGSFYGTCVLNGKRAGRAAGFSDRRRIDSSAADASDVIRPFNACFILDRMTAFAN